LRRRSLNASRRPSRSSSRPGAIRPIAGRLCLSDICRGRRLDVVWTRALVSGAQLLMLIAFLRARSRPIFPFSSQRSSKWPSIARPPRRWASKFQTSCSCRRGYRMRRRAFFTPTQPFANHIYLLLAQAGTDIRLLIHSKCGGPCTVESYAFRPQRAGGDGRDCVSRW
jgi:hypothetical protein